MREMARWLVVLLVAAILFTAIANLAFLWHGALFICLVAPCGWLVNRVVDWAMAGGR